jgi:hypothetical protein
MERDRRAETPTQGTSAMKKYLVATALIAGFAVPALALETNFIMFDLEAKKCVIMTSEPSDASKYKMMGKYGSKADAEAAMKTMKECG